MGKKAAALEAAKQQQAAAVSRWGVAVNAEGRAYEQARSGEQLTRLAHAEALEELREARQGTLNAEAAVAAALDLPEDPAPQQ